MILPNDDIRIITTHSSPVLKVFHFDINQPYHFMSLSDNGEIIEWLFDKSIKKFKEIEKCNLQRPSDEILTVNKHEIRKLKKGEYIKITSVIHFNNFLTVGYDDGLILVYQVEKQPIEKKKKSIEGLQEKIEEENQDEEGENEKVKEAPKNEKVKTSEEIMGELISQIDYYNTFSLYYILLGHSQQIRCLYYVASKKVLVTSSDNCTVKIYDMNNGFSLYHFNLDCIVNKIILVEKKNVQNLIKKKLNEEEAQKKVESNIMNIDIGSRIKDKEIDSSKINKDSNLATIKKLPKSKYGIVKKKEKTKKKKEEKKEGEQSGSDSEEEKEKNAPKEEEKNENEANAE